MSHARHEDWLLLDLAPGADLNEVNKALRFRRSLYQPDALATYNLLDDDERQRMLERIDEAYRRITGSEPPPYRGPQPVAPLPQEPSKPPTGPPPDARLEPGAVLRHRRLQLGWSLERIAADTKIRPALLHQLESEAIDELPAAVFVRGHVLQYARALGLEDASDLDAFFLAKHQLD